jgi:ribokinase
MGAYYVAARIAIAGNINIDFVCEAERAPRPGETLIGRDLRFVAGGKAANQAVGAARLGAQVSLIGRVGHDAFGGALVDSFEREGINVDLISRDEEAATGAAFVVVMPDGENSIVSVLGANDRLAPGLLEEAGGVIERADVLLLQFSIPLESVDRALQIAVDRGVPVHLDPTPTGRGAARLWHRAYRVTPNATEAEALTRVAVTDVPSALEAARKMRRRGVKVPIIKLGAEGCLVLDDRGPRLVPGFRVDVVDTTGAGDAFAAGLAVLTAEGASLDEALLFANACGALACTVFGAQPSLPSREVVERFLKQRQARVDCIERV